MKLPKSLVPTTCKGCGRKIAFAVSDEGKTIPLDMAPVYVLRTSPETGVEIWQRDGIGDTERMAFTSHFATCSAASQFSASKRRDGPGSREP